MVNTLPSDAGDVVSILGQGAKILPTSQSKNQNINSRSNTVTNSMKTLKNDPLKKIYNYSDPSHRKLEKEMATHSSILAWRIPLTEEPGRLQSMRSQESDTTQ